jgi:Zn-dependent protease with chaperone function
MKLIDFKAHKRKSNVMTAERSYMSIFGASILITMAAFWQLFEKYSYTTLFYVVEECYQSLASFFISPFHLVGLAVFSIVFLLSFAFLLRFAFSALLTQRKLSQFTARRTKSLPYRLQVLCRKHQISHESLLVVKNTQPLAFAMGMITQKIVITTGLLKLLSQKELEAVLLHELYHVQHRHGLLLLCAEIISSTLAFFPILLDTLSNMKAHFELAADQFARSKQQTGRYVFSAIHQVVRTQSSPIFTPAFSATIIEQRLQRLSNVPSQATRYTRASVFWTTLSVVTFLALALFPTQQYAAELAPDVVAGQHCDNILLCSTQCRDARLSREAAERRKFSGSTTLSTTE